MHNFFVLWENMQNTKLTSFVFAGLGIKPRALRMLGRCSATQLRPQPFCFERVSLKMPGWALNLQSNASASWVAGPAGVHHHAQLIGHRNHFKVYSSRTQSTFMGVVRPLPLSSSKHFITSQGNCVHSLFPSPRQPRWPSVSVDLPILPIIYK